MLTIEKAREKNPDLASVYGSTSLADLPAIIVRLRQAHAFCGLLTSGEMNAFIHAISKVLPAGASDIDAARAVLATAIIDANNIARRDLELPRWK